MVASGIYPFSVNTDIKFSSQVENSLKTAGRDKVGSGGSRDSRTFRTKASPEHDTYKDRLELIDF